MDWHITTVRLVDPFLGTEQTGDLFLGDGLICTTLSELQGPVCRIDGSGLTAVPGLIDLHVHFREPGNEESENLVSGSRAAAHGGFTTVVTMPNTEPPIDQPDLVSTLLKKSKEIGLTRILPAACVTARRAGTALADLDALLKAGAVVFTDDGTNIAREDILIAAMEKAVRLGCRIFDHAFDPELAGGGIMRQGLRAASLAFPAIPPEAEARAIERDARASCQTGCPIHIQHLSTALGLERLQEGRRQGALLSAEVTPHHLALCDEDVTGLDANYKVNPPLGLREDRAALLAAAADGTIEAFATDHAPHHEKSKASGFLKAPFGVVGLETAVGVTWTILCRSGRMSLLEWLRRWTIGPARILGLPPPSLQPGQPADVALLDLDQSWIVRKEDFLSKSTNSPFLGWRLTGKVVATFLAGKITWADNLLTKRITSAIT
ncbi:MAG: dihydroorotase [Kiritimatiellia bacterium]